MQKSVLMTGATGALGSSLLRCLVNAGHRVWCLVRSSDTQSPEERIQAIVGSSPLVSVISGDIHRSVLCGVDMSIGKSLLGRINAFVHCAATVGFDDPQIALRSNLDGVRNAVDLAAVLDVPDFHHVSTAYVAGDAPRFFEADEFVQQRWRNDYERTKWAGESIARYWSQRPGCQLAIYRPSILVGGEDGSTPSYTGYYGFFRPIHAVIEYVRNLASSGKSLPPDVQVHLDGSVEVPLVIHASWKSTLNLVPIDWAARRMATLVTQPAGNRVYHLVHPTPPKVSWVITMSLKKLGISGVTIVETAQEKEMAVARQSPQVARLQRQVDRVLDFYVPYVTREAIFASPLGETGGIGGDPPRPITETFLARLLDYAVAHHWGANGAQHRE